MKPTILLTTGHDTAPNGLGRFVLYQNYAGAIATAGGAPLLALSYEDAAQYAGLCDGLLLTGGVDVQPKLYGETVYNDTLVMDPARDVMEYAVLKAFLEAGKPVLGICRGMQILDIYFGGSMWQDLPAQKGINHSDTLHSVQTAKGSILEKLFGGEFEVNSYHHQAVNKLGNGLVPIAWDGDIVEAFVHESLPVAAVQWHPERMCRGTRTTPVGPEMNAFFDYFIGLCGGTEYETV